MAHVRQPEGSTCCGQACLATLLGINLERACALVGHSKSTHAAELVRLLPGRCLDSKLRVLRTAPVPEIALLRVRVAAHQSHWVLRWAEVLYDPSAHSALLWETWDRFVRGHRGWTVTSALRLAPR